MSSLFVRSYDAAICCGAGERSVARASLAQVSFSPFQWGYASLS